MPGRSAPVRIAVLSDLHIDSRGDAASLDRALEVFGAAQHEDVDHLVVCGDLFDSAGALHRDGERLQRALRRLRLWHADRLSILPGNHDVTAFGHHSPIPELVRGVLTGVEAGHRTLCRWLRPLVPARTRVWSNTIFPFVKTIGHVRLWGADSVSPDVVTSSSGYWYKDDEEALDRSLESMRSGVRHVLATHHPPISHPPLQIPRLIRDAFGQQGLAGAIRFAQQVLSSPRGFVPGDMTRLRDFLGRHQIDALVCGHIHTGLGRTWQLGPTRVFLEGRSGGLHQPSGRASFGVLSVPRTGRITYRSVRV